MSCFDEVSRAFASLGSFFWFLAGMTVAWVLQLYVDHKK